MRALRTYCFSADTENSILSLKISLQLAGCDLMINSEVKQHLPSYQLSTHYS